MSLDALIDHWKNDPQTASNVAVWQRLPERPAQTESIPSAVPPALRAALGRLGISSLYSHQAQAWRVAAAGNNVVLATGTASGKTLAYNLPVLATLLDSSGARALYLFPTKALAQDQLTSLGMMIATGRKQAHRPHPWLPSTTATRRKDSARGIRKNARLILSNPDMLHTGILPHHTNWDDFFRGLRFVVIDEMHTYRGVFGSHVANVIRRLQARRRVPWSQTAVHPQFCHDWESPRIGRAPDRVAPWSLSMSTDRHVGRANSCSTTLRS